MKRDPRLRLALLLGGALGLLVAGGAAAAGRGPAAPAAVAPGAGRDTLRADALIQPAELARRLAAPAARRPLLLHVGFRVLYLGGHVAGSRYAGAGSTPAGLAGLTRVLQRLPRRQALVLYCGCCPWSECPNVRPAYRTARAMGFRSVKVLYVAHNLKQDWIDRDLPTGKGEE